MKNLIKAGFCLLISAVLLLSLPMGALAEESTVTFKSLAEGFAFQPGSEYTATDLFDNFKNVMPGDSLSQIVRLTNEATDCDYINLYLRAVVHDETENPLSEKVAGSETVASMRDFLSKLTMRIYNGGELIYEASPDEAGALVDNVFLGSLKNGGELSLRVELDVPAELGNQYANRVGEVDWVFLAEGIEYEKLTVHKVWDDNGYPFRPKSIDVNLLRDGEVYETVTLNKDNQWTYTWDELDDRYNWTVDEVSVRGYKTTYTTDGNTVFITNYRDYEPIVIPDPSPEPSPGPDEPTPTPVGPTPTPENVNLTVRKVWSDEGNRENTRPGSVTVTLYNGDTAVDKVTLSEENGWTHTWENLDGSGSWSVIETGIPAGYVPAYSVRDGVVTITNTCRLIQTGQLRWPVPVLGALGLALIVYGVVLTAKKRRREGA